MTNEKIEEKCLECHGNVTVGADVIAGEVVTCPECSTDLEVVSVAPIKLALAPTAQEDWGE